MAAMLRALPYKATVQLLQQIGRVPYLVVFAFARASRGVLQPGQDRRFWQKLNVRGTTDRVSKKSFAIIVVQSLGIRQEPSLHKFNHPEHAIYKCRIDPVSLTQLHPIRWH